MEHLEKAELVEILKTTLMTVKTLKVKLDRMEKKIDQITEMQNLHISSDPKASKARMYHRLARN